MRFTVSVPSAKGWGLGVRAPDERLTPGHAEALFQIRREAISGRSRLAPCPRNRATPRSVCEVSLEVRRGGDVQPLPPRKPDAAHPLPTARSLFVIPARGPGHGFVPQWGPSAWPAGSGRNRLSYIPRGVPDGSTRSGQMMMRSEIIIIWPLRIPRIRGPCPPRTGSYLKGYATDRDSASTVLIKRKREGLRARNIDERETSISCLLHTPHWGCARNQEAQCTKLMHGSR
ncbi:hypothetical protein QTO34_000943 [Cnephaeus nilssonii]|uniref:Uncharacterized protein n=1 Tax=Cnephaeus nilssonii TaxID=3371016 RepID=A0AA40ICE0_CNENI|nr:hypothetical protein QTO34_000943 [Eptesicus nilssonii]